MKFSLASASGICLSSTRRQTIGANRLFSEAANETSRSANRRPAHQGSTRKPRCPHVLSAPRCAATIPRRRRFPCDLSVAQSHELQRRLEMIGERNVLARIRDEDLGLGLVFNLLPSSTGCHEGWSIRSMETSMVCELFWRFARCLAAATRDHIINSRPTRTLRGGKHASHRFCRCCRHRGLYRRHRSGPFGISQRSSRPLRIERGQGRV